MPETDIEADEAVSRRDVWFGSLSEPEAKERKQDEGLGW